MKSMYRKTIPLNDLQAFRAIINCMKTCNTAPLVNKGRYIKYSQHLKKLNSLQDISVLLSGMLDQNIFPNAVIINQLINKMKQLNQLDFALELHGIAASKNIADAITYASTITAIANSATPDVSRALRLFDEATEKFHRPDMKQESLIDLHGLSYGEVYFGLKRRLENELKNTNHTAITLQIIYGRGLHSHASFAAAAHPLKEAVIRVVQEMSAQGVSGKENQYNVGCLNLMIDSHVQSARHQSSALTQNSIFLNTRNSSLNPNANANVFVPRSS